MTTTASRLVDNEEWSSDDTDIETIARALRKVRLAVRADEDEGVPQEVTEAAALNLIVTATEPSLLREAAGVIGELAERHPSRSILFLRKKDEATRLSAHINAYCSFRAGTTRQVCCEQLLIEGRGTYADRLHSIVPALLVPDVPTFVWWRGAPPLQTPMYEKLRQMCQRMVVDSSGFREAFADLSKEVVSCALERCAISDLAWGRLEGWREEIARLFDPADTRVYLMQIETVRIATTVGGYPTEAVLLLGWMCDRLGWQVVSGLRREDGAWTCLFKQGGRTIQCAVQPFAGDAAGGDAIAAVTIGAGRAEMKLESAPGGRFVLQSIAIEGRIVSEGRTGMRSPDLATLLSQELELVNNDQAYEGAVAIGARLSGR